MKAIQKFTLAFYLKMASAVAGKAPLYLRISIDGEQVRIALKHSVLISSWNQKAQRLNGNFPEYAQVRERMRLLTNEVNAAYDELKYEKKSITALAIKNKLAGADDGVMLSALFKYHNEESSKLLSWGTLKNYLSTERFLKEFLTKLRLTDILLVKIDYKFITDFQIFLRTKKPDHGQRPCTNNTVMKHLERFKKLMGLALQFGWGLSLKWPLFFKLKWPPVFG